MDERLTAEWLIPQLNQAQLRFYHLFSAPASTVGYHTYPLAPCDILSILRLDGTESQRYASRFFSAFLSFRPRIKCGINCSRNPVFSVCSGFRIRSGMTNWDFLWNHQPWHTRLTFLYLISKKVSSYHESFALRWGFKICAALCVSLLAGWETQCFVFCKTIDEKRCCATLILAG